MSSDRTITQTLEHHSEPFLYVPTSENGGADSGNTASLVWSGQTTGAKLTAAQLEAQILERGIQEGSVRTRALFEKQLSATRATVATALAAFETQRDNYFSRIEPEVVQLALAIARKILHREAQMDPLLLTGMVHVALEKIDAGTRVRLRVHPSDVNLWKENFAQSDSPQPLPELVGAPELQHGECALETEVGSTHVSLETQLKEIEQGFFDLLGQRPQVR